MEQKSAEYQYSILLDILAEMVTDYLTKNEIGALESEKKWSENHAV
ncbi:hypothetical protein ACIQXV_06920 [Neobacillus sp. NPDC097160]